MEKYKVFSIKYEVGRLKYGAFESRNLKDNVWKQETRTRTNRK